MRDIILLITIIVCVYNFLKIRKLEKIISTKIPRKIIPDGPDD